MPTRSSVLGKEQHPRPSGARFKIQRLTAMRNAWLKQLGNLHKTHQHSKLEERVTRQRCNPNKTSEEVTVSKDDLESVMKRISTSVQEQDSATDPGSGDSMGFSFTAAHEHILSVSTKQTVKMTMVVDSGASDHYVDDTFVKGIKQLMFDDEEFDTPRIISTAGLHTLLGTATENLRSKVTESNGRTRMATLPVTIVRGIGRNLFSVSYTHLTLPTKA